ncbi:MAG: DNA polymerase ligase N-terminal domain-containing protein [Chromatiaceae bacterium]
MAIAVENHDLSFGVFEGEIPRGEYGAGRVTIWDRRTYLPSCWGDDRITFELFGARLAETFTLTRFVRAGPDRWLLFKHGNGPGQWAGSIAPAISA